jgi:uncharacterized protein (DUF1800 family)
MTRLHPMLAAYQPSAEDPFDAVKAAHLLNRAGFGGTRQEIEEVVRLGPADAVDQLLDFPDAGADEMSQTDVPDLSSIEGMPKSYRELKKLLDGKTEQERQALRQKFMRANREALEVQAAWWLRRMAYGPYPMQEKLTLFWHGHFTTSAKDERSSLLIWKQNETLRRCAAGNFRQFVQQISRDPAMLDYLNNSQNRKQRPNENYARELMELFTLGIGNYSERDIKEAARAFTGWAHNGEDYVFRKFDHDEGEKVFFGRRGDFNGDDVIDIILLQQQCGRYIGRKVFNYFAYDAMEPGMEESLGNVLRENKYELRPLLRTILTSKAFYSPRAVGVQIKSPIQMTVGTIRILELEMPPTRMLMGALNQMGQMPYFPPNVKGWPGGRAWINTSTMFVRYNTAVWLAGGEVPINSGRPFADAVMNARARRFDPVETAEAEPAVDEWVSRLIQRPIAPEKRQVLIDAMKEQSLREVIQLIVSMPEYQLC